MARFDQDNWVLRSFNTAKILNICKIKIKTARVGVAVVLGLVQPLALAAIPSAFVTRLYTEALGRAPDAPGWKSLLASKAGMTCTLAMAQDFGRNFYSSSEYLMIPYDSTERVIMLYRGLLGRDPDPSGLANYVSFLANGGSFSALVEAFVTSGEFTGYEMNANGSCRERLAWGSQAAPSGLQKGSGFYGSQNDLQTQLNSLSATGGGTIYLAQRAVIQLSSRLDIPDNVRLATYGLPNHNQYAKQARLVRGSLFSDVMVSVGRYNSLGSSVNSTLESVWVSGQRQIVGFGVNSSITGNIIVPGGAGMLVKNVRTDTPAGWSTLYLHGRAESRPCGSATVRSNLSVGYGSAAFETNSDGSWADGISNACENALIEDNHIVDPTDVGIVLFRSTPATQRSTVRNNFIVSGGLPVIAAIGVETLGEIGPHDFTGSHITSNSLFAAPEQFIVFGAALGARQWGIAERKQAVGVSFIDNTTNGVSTRMQSAIYVDGAVSAVVSNNTLTRAPYIHPRASTCVTGDFVANSLPNWASGSFSPTPSYLSMVPGCLK